MHLLEMVWELLKITLGVVVIFFIFSSIVMATGALFGIFCSVAWWVFQRLA